MSLKGISELEESLWKFGKGVSIIFNLVLLVCNLLYNNVINYGDCLPMGFMRFMCYMNHLGKL